MRLRWRISRAENPFVETVNDRHIKCLPHEDGYYMCQEDPHMHSQIENLLRIVKIQDFSYLWV